MGFAVIARCDRTGEIGIALASEALAGGACLYGAIRPNAGGVLILGVTSLRLNHLATHLLAQGHSAAHVLLELKENDVDIDSRQIAVVDRDSCIATHCGAGLQSSSGCRSGEGFAVLCDRAGAESADSLAEAFQATAEESLDSRLLRSLESGDAALRKRGGLQLCSAALVVWGRRDYSDIDLRVDSHAWPVTELRRIFVDFKPTAAYYEERARNPSQAINAKEFAGILQRQKDQAA